MNTTATEPDDTDDRHGHRARLRARFVEGGIAAVADYEMLELVLFSAIPRRDVRPLAKALIRQFGGFAEVLGAEPAALRRVEGIGEAAIAAIKLVAAAATLMGRERVLNRSVLSSWDALISFCRTAMASLPVEHVRLLFLDRKNQLIHEEVHQYGTVDHAPLYPREVMRRALEVGASALIIVHNHPSGDPSPSRGDIEMTREIEAAAKIFGIVLHDHVIIGRKSHASFKSLGLL